MTQANVNPIPEGMPTLTPHLICANAVEAMEFYKRAFGAEGLHKMTMPDGRLMHGMMRIGSSPIMLAEEVPEWNSFGPTTLKGSPVVLHLYVPDVDAAIEQARHTGAKVIMAAADMFWGDRYGQVQDPYGHRWSLATHIRDVSPEEMAEAAQHGCN